jgi:predicted nucleic acid-binding protein
VLRAAVIERLESAGTFFLPVMCLGEFWRVATETRGMNKSPAATAQFVAELLQEFPLLLPGPRYGPILLELLELHRPRGARVFDFQIAAVCLEHRVEAVWSFDQRFPRLDGLAVVDPSL